MNTSLQINFFDVLIAIMLPSTSFAAITGTAWKLSLFRSNSMGSPLRYHILGLTCPAVKIASSQKNIGSLFSTAWITYENALSLYSNLFYIFDGVRSTVGMGFLLVIPMCLNS